MISKLIKQTNELYKQILVVNNINLKELYNYNFNKIKFKILTCKNNFEDFKILLDKVN